jgi:hypothetical protein
MKWMDERKTWENLRHMIALCILCGGWTIESGIIYRSVWVIALIFTVLVAIRCIYLCLTPSLYQGKLDRRMNNVIAILNIPIYVALVVLFAFWEYKHVVL